MEDDAGGMTRTEALGPLGRRQPPAPPAALTPEQEEERRAYEMAASSERTSPEALVLGHSGLTMDEMGKWRLGRAVETYRSMCWHDESDAGDLPGRTQAERLTDALSWAGLPPGKLRQMVAARNA